MERPKIIEGKSYQITAGCEHLYVTISGEKDNGASPIELIAKIGKAGGCTNCLNEAIGRVVSIGLQWGVPIEEYMNTLRGLQCDNPKPFPPSERCLSCPDGISVAIRKHLEKDDKST